MTLDVRRKASSARATSADVGTVGASTVTQRHSAKGSEADHARLDAAWGIQLARDADTGLDEGDVQRAAARGIAGGGSQLPHLESIQRSFGEHDVSGVRAHTGGEAAEASRAMGAHGYATGNDVAFAESSPSLFLVAHEAAHVVQQRAGVSLKGAVGQAGDSYEQHADAVASRVVAGQSAADLLGSVGSGGGTAVQRDAKPDTAKPTGMSVQSGSRMAENSYRRLFANERAGLTRLGAALKKDETPPKSLLSTVMGGVVGGAIGAILGPVGPAVVGLVESEIAKKVIEKIADKVKDKAVEIGSEAAKEHFLGGHKTDAADNFVEAQTLAINDAEHAAVEELLRHTDEVTGVDHGPESLAALAGQIDVRAKTANDLQVVQSAGAWARLTADRKHESARAWANDDAGGDNEKGAIEIHMKHVRGEGPPVITGSNWRGVGRETEGVVEEHGSQSISALGATLRVTIETYITTTHFEALPNGEVIVPAKSTYQQALIVAGGAMLDSSASFKGLEADATSAAKFLLYEINQMPVSSLKFGK